MRPDMRKNVSLYFISPGFWNGATWRRSYFVPFSLPYGGVARAVTEWEVNWELMQQWKHTGSIWAREVAILQRVRVDYGSNKGAVSNCKLLLFFCRKEGALAKTGYRSRRVTWDQFGWHTGWLSRTILFFFLCCNPFFLTRKWWRVRFETGDFEAIFKTFCLNCTIFSSEYFELP